MTTAINFKIIKQTKMMRVGELSTSHGLIQTPAFIVGGTKATVKTLTNQQIEAIHGQAILANTYHLMLQPGGELINQVGGINKFMNWSKPTFTDSGGFQIFSLGIAYKKGIDLVASSQTGQKDLAKPSGNQLAKVSEEGVYFKSHLDGQQIFLSPEKSMDIQHLIAADIHMAFDELTAPLASEEIITAAMQRTHRWAERCLSRHLSLNEGHRQRAEPLQALYAVVQGGRNLTNRQESSQFLNNLAFDGFGIGGIFEATEIPSILTTVNQILANDKPRHLLGMGSQPLDLFLGVEYGIDTFDCIAATRQARNGSIYTETGRINIKNARFKTLNQPISLNCQCYTCLNHSLAYLNHLFKANEILGLTLASIHNEYFVINIVDRIRQAILDDNYFSFKKDFLNNYYQRQLIQ